MQLHQRFDVATPLDEAWAFFRDVPAVAAYMPGVERIEATGPDAFAGALRLKVGPLGFRLTGRVVRRAVDDQQRAATLEVSAEDRGLASAVNATLRLSLISEGDGTQVTLDTDANVMGKLGQFGQGVVKFAADGVMKPFAACVRERLSQPESVAISALVESDKGVE